MIRCVPFALCALGLAGCCCAPASTGWQFTVGRPPTVNSSALINQGPGLFAVSPLGTYPGAPVPAVAPARPALAYAAAAPCPPQAPAGPPAARLNPNLAAADPCEGVTMAEVCQRLIALERQLRQVQAAEKLPAPKPLP